MADDILKNIPLPADLPENWTSGQIIAPTGAEAGLDDQHGYNYLMRQVNNAQKAATALNKGKADSVVPHDLSIPITGWQTDTEVAEYPHYIDITADVTSTTVVSVSIDPASADVAGKAMLVNPETRTGAIRIRAHNIPTAEISARWYPIKYGGQFYGDGSIYSNFLLAAHPVGSIYQTISPENPAVTFGGGTWERIEGRFIMGASDTYPAGSTGGSATHHLTQSEIPNYLLMPNMMHSTGEGTGGWGSPIRQNDGGYIATEYQLETKGGNQPMDILNPYYSVYIWRRVA